LNNTECEKEESLDSVGLLRSLHVHRSDSSVDAVSYISHTFEVQVSTGKRYSS